MMLLRTFFPVLAFADQVLGVWPLDHPGYDFWFWQSAVAVDGYLYIDAGEYYILKDGDDGNGIWIEYTTSVDLSSSWTVANVSGTRIAKPPAMSLNRQPPMWYDPAKQSIMRKGGWPYSGYDTTLYQLKLDGKGGGLWQTSADYATADEVEALFATSYAQSANATYFYGGALSKDLGTLAPGLTSYVFETGKWTNVSTDDAPSGRLSLFGEAVFVTNFGLNGLFVSLGGEGFDDRGWQAYREQEDFSLEDALAKNLVPLTDISIFDVHSGKWYLQKATGDVPPPRIEFCAQSQVAADGSSFEIFVFGGTPGKSTDSRGTDDAGYTDVYILSLPSFTWVRANRPIVDRRAAISCRNLGEGQVLVIGGYNPTNTGAFWSAPKWDPWTRSMNLFDMSKMEWTGTWDANIDTYTRPDVINRLYEGTATTSWSDPAISSLFNVHPLKQLSLGSPSSSTTDTSSGDDKSDGGSDTPVGAIVGGAVGAVVMLAILFGFVIWLRRRRHNKQRLGMSVKPSELPTKDSSAELPTAEAKQELHGDGAAQELETNEEPLELPG